MRHLLCTTAAALLFAPAVLANGGAGHEWPELDRELEALSESMAVKTNGPRLWGYVRTNYAWSDELRNAAGQSFSGVSMDNVRLAVDGNVDRYSYRVSADMASGTLNLLDAYANIPIGENLAGTFGQFKSPFLSSGLVEARDVLFITRTRNGVFSSIRDAGVQVKGDYDRFHWALAAQNGASGTADKALLTARAMAELIGEPMPAWEGAYSAGDESRVNMAVAFQMDDAASDSNALAVEATAIFNRVYLHGEIVDYGDAWSFDPNFPGEQRGGTTPWTLVASLLLPNERWELAMRYDDYDDTVQAADFDRSVFTAGANYYVAGHDLKWQFNYAYGRNGGADDGADANIVAVGLTLAF